LITLTTPYQSKSQSDLTIQPSSYANYHTSNSDGTWDIHHKRSDPQGYFSRYSQDWGGLEELIILERRGAGSDSTPSDEYHVERTAIDKKLASSAGGLRDLVRAFSELVGKPLLVPRDWLGYLASGMGLGESVSMREGLVARTGPLNRSLAFTGPTSRSTPARRMAGILQGA
jgi:hypothetical protein